MIIRDEKEFQSLGFKDGDTATIQYYADVYDDYSEIFLETLQVLSICDNGILISNGNKFLEYRNIIDIRKENA